MTDTEMVVQDDFSLVMQGMDNWHEEVKSVDCIRINHSMQEQIYNYLRFNGTSPLTYDLRRDKDVKKSKRGVWFGIAYRMQLQQGVDTFDAMEWSLSNWRSVRSAVYNLQTTSIATMPILYATAHKKDGRDVEVVTFDGDYMLACGKPVTEIVSERDTKKWKSHLEKTLQRKGLSNVQVDQVIGKAEAVVEKRIGSIERKMLVNG